MSNLQELTKEQQEELLGKAPKPSLYYKFGDYKYNTDSKERVLSGIERLDELTKGFEMGVLKNKKIFSLPWIIKEIREVLFTIGSYSHDKYGYFYEKENKKNYY